MAKDPGDPKTLLAILRNLPKSHLVAFAASCCETLLPNYQAFSLMEEWGNYGLLRRALDQIWQFAQEGHLPKKELRSLHRECEDITPDPDDFSTIFTSAAMDAGVAVRATLECCVDGDIERAAEAAQLAIETVDMYLQIVGDPSPNDPVSDPKMESWISKAPLMTFEIKRQAGVIAILRSHDVLDAPIIDRIRRLSSTRGLQPLRRGFVKRDTESDLEDEDGYQRRGG